MARPMKLVSVSRIRSHVRGRSIPCQLAFNVRVRENTKCHMGSVIVTLELSFLQIGRRLRCDNG
jgi:hypothetical protein